jgi:hypothetical protein
MRIVVALLKGVSNQLYTSQTKILEGGTKDEIRMFETLFKGVSTRFGRRTIEKSMLPKRRFWKEEQKMKSGFSTDFSMVRGPNRVLTPLKSASNIRISSFVPPSKIFVWEG